MGLTSTFSTISLKVGQVMNSTNTLALRMCRECPTVVSWVVGGLVFCFYGSSILCKHRLGAYFIQEAGLSGHIYQISCAATCYHTRFVFQTVSQLEKASAL